MPMAGVRVYVAIFYNPMFSFCYFLNIVTPIEQLHSVDHSLKCDAAYGVRLIYIWVNVECVLVE